MLNFICQLCIYANIISSLNFLDPYVYLYFVCDIVINDTV